MSRIRGLIRFIPEIFRFARDTRKMWLSILILFLLFLGMIILLTESATVMPFIYTLF